MNAKRLHQDLAENTDLKNLVNTNISIIENLKQRNNDIEKKFGEEVNFGNQKLDYLSEEK